MKIICPILFNLLIILSYAWQISGITKIEKDEILQDYDKSQPPPTSNTSGSADIKVTFRLFHLYLSLDYEEEALSLTGVFHFMWTDKRLASTNNFRIFSLSLDEIWSGVPSIAYIAGSKILELGSGEKKRNSAVIFNRGFVLGGSVLSLQSVKACRSDLTNWPYDTKFCEIYFISPANNGARVLYDPVILMDRNALEKSVDCKGWDIEQLYFYDVKNGTRIVLSFQLKRKGVKLANYFYLPAIVNLLLSLSLFFLEPQSRDRFILLLLVTITQFYFLKSLSLLVPHYYNNQRPTLEFFIEMSTVLIFIQIFLVIFCRAMTQTEYNPSFLSKIVSMVVMSRVLKILFLLDVEPKVANELIEEQEEEESYLIATKNQTKNQWQLLSRVIHQGTFYFAVIFSLYLVCIII